MESFNNMTSLLKQADEILRTYSNGTLPLPHYTTVSLTQTVSFGMSTSGDVEKWSFATDTPVRTSEYEGRKHFTVEFTHDEIRVTVYYIAPAQ